MNATSQLSVHILKLIKELQKQVATMDKNNNTTNPTMTTNTCKPTDDMNTKNNCHQKIMLVS